MNDLFNRDPALVAKDIEGKMLFVQGKEVRIVRMLPRTEADNRRWLKTKPLFGDSPVEVYVAPHRGSFLLFLRTMKNTCIRLEEVEFEGRRISGPGRICSALGIGEEKTGTYHLQENGIVILWDAILRAYGK